MILITQICVPGHYVPQLSQAIVRYNSAIKERTINLRGYMVLALFYAIAKIPDSLYHVDCLNIKICMLCRWEML
jgi:carboxypeptidase C (cathepsin A)